MVLLAASRRYGEKIRGKSEDILVPFADMINHKHPGAKTKWDYVEKRGFFITATADIQKGEEVFISYGVKSSAEWFMNYGFIDVNSHDQVPL